MGILDLDVYRSHIPTFSYPAQGNCPMLNSDLDLDTDPNHRVTRSSNSLPNRHIPTELSIKPSIFMPIFAEATAQAARLTDAPVAILTTIDRSGYQIVAHYGLASSIELIDRANLQIELVGLDYCHSQTIASTGTFMVNNFLDCPQLSDSSLDRVHGMRSYLGLPIFTAAQDLFGTLSILDAIPRQFSDRDIEILRLVGRLVASEFERKCFSQAQLNCQIEELQNRSRRGFDDPAAAAEHDRQIPSTDISPRLPHHPPIATPQVQSEIKFQLLTHLAQELRTPLTSVLGMASVLQQEIYGRLSGKQKDYVSIIHHSSQQLVTIVDEIAQLGGFVGEASAVPNQQQRLTLKSVDMNMLCQLAIQSLEPLAQKKQQQITLDLAESAAVKIWWLDKDKVRQIVYYLSLSLIHTTAEQHQIVIRLTHLTDGLQLQILTSDPQAMLGNLHVDRDLDLLNSAHKASSSILPPLNEAIEPQIGQDLRIRLGLALSQALATAHGGRIEAIANGLGYQLSLPLIVTDEISGCPDPQIF